ncbi:MAG: 6-bladed beta-propeller [Prevotellaceae bacterium]|nr:6-bladed beta-propeller [Prevotellaceae bacterium]
MKKLYHIYIKLFTFIFILTGCSGLPVSSDITTVDIKPQLENSVTLYASDIISEMRYIALETTNSSLLSSTGNIIIQQNGYFLMRDRNSLYMFDSNGKYIHQISKQGQGAEEYVNINNFDADNDNIYIYDGPRRRILVYSYDNKYLKTIKQQSNNITNVTHIHKLPEGFLCYQEPAMLYKKYKEAVPDLILFDENGNEKKILHYRTLNIDGSFPFMYGVPIPCFKKHNGRIFIYLPLQDTIFSVNGENLNPEIVINRGEHAVYPESMDSKDKRRIVDEKGVIVNKFTLNDKYLILCCEYRKQNVTFVYDFETKELKNVSKIINDFDNTYDIFTFDLTNNQMLDRKHAFEIIEEDRIPESVKNLKEDDNPVIRISTLK